jgi:aristolochene synthase
MGSIDVSAMNPRSRETQGLFTPLTHPDTASAIENVHSWFLNNWDFPTEKSKKKFIDAGFSRVTCLYFPKSLPERIESACKLLTILFLVDGEPFSLRRSCAMLTRLDQLEYMSLEDGQAYNEQLMGLCTGHIQVGTVNLARSCVVSRTNPSMR